MKVIKNILKKVRERKNQIIAKTSTFLAAAFITAMTVIPASAADGATGQIVTKITELQGSGKTIAQAVSILMFIGAGLTWMFGPRGKENGKSWVINIAVGVMIVSLASALASFFIL